MSKNVRASRYLERRIYERPFKSEPNFIENQSEHISKLSLHQSLVKRLFTAISVSRTRVHVAC